jgi:hypothetical protein
MYHYVRRHEDALPHQRFLHADDFVRQLDHFAATDGFVDRSVFEEAVADGRPAPGIVLTFDDALRDHAEVVWPLLEERDLWGTFYVPSAPYRTGRLLDVHRLHVLTGSLPGTELLRLVRHLVDDDQLVHDHVEEFHRSTYGRIDDDAATDQVKRTLNYLIADEHRAAVVDALMVAAGIDETDAAAAF